MTSTASPTAKEIRQAADVIVKARPAYEKVVSFFTDMFVLQEEAKSGIELEPILISEKMLKAKLEGNFPLIEPEQFTIDPKAALSLFSRLCQRISENDAQMSVTAQVLSEAIAEERYTPAPLFPAILKENHALFKTTAEDLGIDQKVLAFITYNAVKPSITLCAEQLAQYLDSKASHTRAICPVCGSGPGMSILADQGKRLFSCGFCWHQWPVIRIYCPFCENTDGKTLYYGYNENEPEYRVDICEKCKKYLKTVDLRKMDRFLYPPLEHVATLHLDMTAAKEGNFGPTVYGI